MLIKVKKQVEETMEVKTPSYYKTVTGYHFIDEKEMVTVSTRMISSWSVSDGKYFNEEIERIISNGRACEKEEFDKVYGETMAKFNIAVGAVLF